MKIGTVKEIKTRECRVGLTPQCVKAYTTRGHQLFVQTGSGLGTGFTDEQYTAAGATILPTAKEVFDACDMIVKVKEPLPEEYDLFHPGQILYTYLHLAASKELTDALLERKIKAVAYETIETADGSLPCLKPMSEIAGRLSIQEGAKYLEKTYGGRGILLGGVPGVARGKVAILGGGIAGTNACKMAVGLGADVTVLDINPDRMVYLDDIFSTHITTLYSNDHNIEHVLKESDLVIGAVLIPGAKAPKLIKKQHLKMMKPGSVFVDIAVDQGGSAETTRPTTHDEPIYVIDDVVHYCVANMPGAVALSSTIALTSVTLPYGLKIAEQGLESACRQSQPLAKGVNVYLGKCVYEPVAQDHGLKYTPLGEVLE
ncbi:Alanine dehydrogenase [Anaerohalosphaera lusitana]|uniref:Alanine dehydrogenase n=1 Tax=Anaerohalosphaera lusitana TaxID=1936003 RepID=A0A1U9NI06_9BACT|nr:alanine dehydrogenase [Anaerohalosphaera lusitana]AQT67146.1 Alanine dehydrogenase [Anaerohalosphaera lusitana]